MLGGQLQGAQSQTDGRQGEAEFENNSAQSTLSLEPRRG